MTAAEFADLPFGGHAGEWLSHGQAAPARPPQPLVIEPPPWAGIEAGLFAQPALRDTEQPTALETMPAEDGDDADRWPDPTAPVEVVAPMVRFVPDPPDWRAEEAERQRQRAAEAQVALEPPRSPYPVSPGAERAAREP